MLQPCMPLSYNKGRGISWVKMYLAILEVCLITYEHDQLILVFILFVAIVDELSEPMKYQSAADKRAAQMVVFGIDEIVS